MISDLWVYELGDVILLNLPGETKAAVLAKLDQFIFSEDVQLGDVSDDLRADRGRRPGGRAAGGRAARCVPDVPGVSLGRCRNTATCAASSTDDPAIVTARRPIPASPASTCYVEREQSGCAEGSARRPPARRKPATRRAEALRIEAGVPAFHRDMDEETIPLEAGIESRAISMTKGCYVGQEVIIRVLHRGHGRVARKLVGLVLDGEAAPARGTRRQQRRPRRRRDDERGVGRRRSAVRSRWPTCSATSSRPARVLSVDGAQATVTALPFVQS